MEKSNEKSNSRHDNESISRRITRSQDNSYVGSIIWKEFPPHGYYEGKIVSFADNFYHIIYCDGDEEDVDEYEARNLVRNFQTKDHSFVGNDDVQDNEHAGYGDDDANSVIKLQSVVTLALIDAGFQCFSESIEGGSKSKKDSIAQVRHLSRFIVWTVFNIQNTTSDEMLMIQKFKNNQVLERSTVLEWLVHLLKKKFRIIGEFTKSLHDGNIDNNKSDKPLASSTIRNYLFSIRNGGIWLYMSENVSEFGVTQHCMQSAEHIIKCYSNRYQQDALKQRSMTKNDVEKWVREGKIPQHGMSDIQRVVQGKISLMRSICRNAQHVSRADYTRFVGFTVASLYAYAAQGRIAGICAMTTECAEELLSVGTTGVHEFKTSRRYGIQPISTDSNGQEAIKMYLQYLRPDAIKRGIKANEYHADPKTLWVMHGGKPYYPTSLGK